jgi:hypothetical protein
MLWPGRKELGLPQLDTVLVSLAPFLCTTPQRATTVHAARVTGSNPQNAAFEVNLAAVKDAI